MGVTNFDSLALSNTLEVTGTVTFNGTQDFDDLYASGTTRVSGIFSASASGKQSSMTKLNVSGTTRVSGLLSATASGKDTYIGSLKVSSAANAICGIRKIATAATTGFTIATTKALSSSRIFLTPRVSATAAPATVRCYLASVNSGTSFSVKLNYGATPTGVTGAVNWLIINK